MAVTADRTRPRADPGASHPFHAFALSGAFVLFLGALLADYAYWSSHQIQWSNFASWLLVGGMVLASIAVLCEVFALFVGGRSWLRVLVVAATWVVGFFDALHHGRDAWAIMPAALNREFATITELAEREGIAPSYITRVLRLTLLAPDTVEAILEGTHGPEMTLARVLEPFPLQWSLLVGHFR